MTSPTPPIIFNPGDYRSAERLYLLGGKYEVNGAGFIDYPWQVQYGDLNNPDAVNVHGYVTFPSRGIYHIRHCGEGYTLRNCIEYGYGGTIECRDEATQLRPPCESAEPPSTQRKTSTSMARADTT